MPVVDSNGKTGSKITCTTKKDVADNPAVEDEEPAVEDKPDEPTVEEKPEEPAIEGKLEKLAVEDKLEERAVEKNTEETPVEEKLEEPVVDKKAEELAVEEKLEEPLVKEKPEEQSREVTEAPIKEAKLNQNANEASSSLPTAILSHPPAQGTTMTNPILGEPISIDKPKNVQQLDSQEISEIDEAMQRDEDNIKQKDEASFTEEQKFTPQSE